MSKLINQTVLPLAEVPAWVNDNAGFKPNRSTVFRWKTRGCRGKRLHTFRIGGRVCTSIEALMEFFSDNDQPALSHAGSPGAEAYLASEGFQ